MSPPLPASIDELKQRITSARDNVTETCYNMFGQNLTTDLTCTVLQVVHLLNTYEISPRINL